MLSISWVDPEHRILKVVEQTPTVNWECYYNMYTSQFKHHNHPWWPMTIAQRNWVSENYISRMEK
jgi:hypothetical protein